MAGGRRAVAHVDGGLFRFGLEELPAELGIEAGSLMEDFRSGGDGIAEIAVRTGVEGADDHGLVAF